MAPATPANPGLGKPGGWDVTNVSQSVGPDGTGRTVEGYAVQFTSGLGVAGKVFVPRDQFTPDGVRAAVAAHAADLDAVMGSAG